MNLANMVDIIQISVFMTSWATKDLNQNSYDVTEEQFQL